MVGTPDIKQISYSKITYNKDMAKPWMLSLHQSLRVSKRTIHMMQLVWGLGVVL